MDPSKRGRSLRDVLDRIQQGQERMARPIQGVRVSELHALTEKELAEKHDALVEEAANTAAHYIEQKTRILEPAQVYADELARREAAEQEERLEALTRSLNKLTWWIVALTVLIAIATLIGVALTAWTLLLGA